MKFGDKVTYGYWHYLNHGESFWMRKEAIFVKKEGVHIWIVCKGNKSITKTTTDQIEEA